MQAANASPTDCGFSHGKPRNPCIFQQGPYLVGFFGELEHILGVIYLGDLKRCRLREPHVGAVVGKI